MRINSDGSNVQQQLRLDTLSLATQIVSMTNSILPTDRFVKDAIVVAEILTRFIERND